MVEGIDTVIDSGTTIIYGPIDVVKAFWDAVPESTAFDASPGFYTYPCNQTLNVSFNWGGKDWVIDDKRSVKVVVIRLSGCSCLRMPFVASMPVPLMARANTASVPSPAKTSVLVLQHGLLVIGKRFDLCCPLENLISSLPPFLD